MNSDGSDATGFYENDTVIRQVGTGAQRETASAIRFHNYSGSYEFGRTGDEPG